MTLGTSVTWPRLGLRSRGTLGHFRDQRERFVMESHQREAPSPRTLSNGSGSSKSLACTYGARLWATSRPLSNRLGRPLGSLVSNSLETPCSVPSEGNKVLSPLPPCGKATKGRTIKVETVLDRPLAPCRGSEAALAPRLWPNCRPRRQTNLKTWGLTMHPGYGQTA
jgi:hypothetical protein